MDLTEEIPVGVLMADLQTTLTEIYLLEMLPKDIFEKHYIERYESNLVMRAKIEAIMKERFDSFVIQKFLECGYPRTIDTSSILGVVVEIETNV